ncbi:MAG TPA: ATP-binding protein [Polyangiaceae bacterium]|nr:ATP-binding protein [Polyangiaceae bacterium]
MAGIAHDINNVFTVVRLHAESVLSGSLTSAQRRDLGSAINATLRGAALTKQMLGLARNHARETEICALNEIVSGLAESLATALGPDIALATELSPAPNQIWSTPGQVERILLNLVLNARDAMPDGGRLTVIVQLAVIARGHGLADELPPGAYATLSVQDTGLGMSPELKAMVFEPFFTTKLARGGAGLGLAVVLQQVRELRGAIRLESELGKGSTFTVYLPLVVETADVGGAR